MKKQTYRFILGTIITVVLASSYIGSASAQAPSYCTVKDFKVSTNKLSYTATATKKKLAVDLYHDIVATSFEWMRTGKMQRLVNSEHEYLHYQGHELETNQ